jgi:DNA-binding transcriptional ArsR family regulator
VSEELNETQVRIYLYLVTHGGDASVREIARELKLSPSTVHYHLKRLEEMGYIEKTSNGYIVKKPIRLRSHVVLGKFVIPRLLIYGLFFTGVFVGTAIYIVQNGINSERLLLLIVSLVAAVVMYIEATVGAKFYK